MKEHNRIDNNPQQKEFVVIEEKPDHHYRTEIPNIIFELNLTPYDFTVYAYLKRIAGDYGQCFKSRKTMAKECGISERQLAYSLKNLAEGKNSKKLILIKISQRKNSDGSKTTSIISISEIWRKNGNHFRGLKKSLRCAPYAPGGAPYAHKEEPLEESTAKAVATRNEFKNTLPFTDFPDAVKPKRGALPLPLFFAEEFKQLGLTAKAAQEIRDKYSEEQIRQAYEYTKSRSPTKPSGYFIQALSEGWKLIPETILDIKRKIAGILKDKHLEQMVKIQKSCVVFPGKKQLFYDDPELQSKLIDLIIEQKGL
jgi:AraC-like DNA-binding protein